MKGQQIDPSELPQMARKDIGISTDLPLTHGIGQLEQMVHGAEPGKMLQLQLASFPLIVNLMNLEGQWDFNVERLYWSVSPTALQGVIDQVRTKLAVLVAEMSATMPAGAEIPSAEVAANAFSVAVEGKRTTVTVTSAQGGSTILRLLQKSHASGCVRRQRWSLA
jgi:AbiTii